MGLTLRRNKGHWIIALLLSPDRQPQPLRGCMPNLLAFALPHFPSCFCNGFPFGGRGGQLLSLSLSLSLPPSSLSRIINQNLASSLAGRRKGPIWGNIRRGGQTERQAAEQSRCGCCSGGNERSTPDPPSPVFSRLRKINMGGRGTGPAV